MSSFLPPFPTPTLAPAAVACGFYLGACMGQMIPFSAQTALLLVACILSAEFTKGLILRYQYLLLSPLFVPITLSVTLVGAVTLNVLFLRSLMGRLGALEECVLHQEFHLISVGGDHAEEDDEDKPSEEKKKD